MKAARDLHKTGVAASRQPQAIKIEMCGFLPEGATPQADLSCRLVVAKFSEDGNRMKAD